MKCSGRRKAEEGKGIEDGFGDYFVGYLDSRFGDYFVGYPDSRFGFGGDFCSDFGSYFGDYFGSDCGGKFSFGDFWES